MPNTATAFSAIGILDGESSYTLSFDLAAGDGVWFDISGIRSASIHAISLAAGDNLVVQVSNAPTVDNAVDGVTEQTITGSGSAQFVTITKLPARWMKLDKTGSTAVAIAHFHGITR